jgi:hypothetical protein
MRKLVTAVIAVGVIAGGAAWYAFSYLPAQIRGEIDATIASLKPRVTIAYASVDIDIFDRVAVFTDVTVTDETGGASATVSLLTVSSGEDEDKFDARLESVSVTYGKTPVKNFLASVIGLEGLSIDPVTDTKLSAGSSAGLDFLRRIGLRKLTIRKVQDKDKKFTVENAVLEDLSQSRFANASVSGIYGKDPKQDIEFSVADFTAANVDIIRTATLPRTFRGQPDWSKLDIGKISVAQFRLKNKEVSIKIGETLSDGVKAGRIVRFRIAGLQMTGTGKNNKPVEVGLDKLEINNFPIITDFPKTLVEFQSFQARHKNLIYDGFDIRNFKVAADGGSFEIHSANVPKPTFRKTPSGAQYPAKVQMSMDMRADFAAFKQAGKPLDPIVGKIFKDLKAQITISARSSADHEKKTGTIDTMTLAIPGVARLQLSGDVGNLPLRYYEAPNDPIVQQIAFRQVTLGALDLTLINDGLAETLLDIAAKRNKTTRALFAQQLGLIVRSTVTADGSPEGLAIAGQIETFLRKPRSIKLSLKPRQTLPVMALVNPELLQSVGKVSKVLGLKIEANSAHK